ncbi:MAG TPA: hypothetical protein VK588_06740, partial [Chitinophagaceae bacterium]|nr:hypothetical protein [Chitinophagaceae bacterium]
MRTITVTLLLSLVIAFTSCEKEVNYANNNNSNNNTGGTGGNSTQDIIGTYDFVGISAHTESTVTVNTGGQDLKSVTISDYTSKDNTGTIQITSSQFISNNLGYAIDTIMNVKSYTDNVLIDDSDFPFTETIPGSGSTSPYTRITADSISIVGALGAPSDPSGTIPTGPVGVKLAWSGDTLLLKINSSFTQPITQGGVTG